MKAIARSLWALTLLGAIATIVTVVEWKAFLPFSMVSGPAFDYGIVLDAGSHGTRAHLYKWEARVQDPNKPFEKPVTIPTQIYVAQDAPGISTYSGGNTDDIGPNLLAPLVDQMIDKLKKEKVSTNRFPIIPISLKATAGMRDISPDVRASVFRSIRSFLETTPFQFKSENARTISGEEEGMFGWLSTNQAESVMFSGPEQSIGSIDMGGASAQIVFQPVHTSIMEDSYEVTLGEEDVRLYSHSYLGYGWGDSLGRLQGRMAVEVVLGHLAGLKWPEYETKQFSKAITGKELIKLVEKYGSEDLHLSPRLKSKLAKNSDKDEHGTISLEAENPCFPKGFDFIFEVPDVSYPDGRMFLDVDKEYMMEYMQSIGLGEANDVVNPVEPIISKPAHFDPSVPHHVLNDPAKTRDGGKQSPFVPFDGYHGRELVHYKIHWIGSGNYDQCRDRAKSLFYQQPCFTHSCSFNGIYQPRIEGSKFKGFGQFSKIVDALKVPANPSLKTLDDAAGEVCSLSYDELIQKAKKGEFGLFNEKKVHKLCWKSLWSLTFLVDGLKFPSDSQAITFMSPSSEEGGWTLGSIIYDVNRLPYAVATGRFKWPFYLASTTAIFAIATLAVLHFTRPRAKESGQDQYQSV